MTEILTVTMNPSIDISASTDEVVPVRKLRCGDIIRDPGGGGINVARVIRRLGAECRALYPAGGPSGHLLHRLLDEEGIVSVPIDVVADTRESFTVLENASDDQYRFVLAGAPLGEEEWRECLDKVAAFSKPPDYLVASGSLPLGVPADFYAKLARIAKEFGTRAVVDTSGPALAAALKEGVYLVKPNLRELRDLTGRSLERETEWEDVAAELVRSGAAEIVTLTLGDQGALLVSRDLRIGASAISVKIASAVGAGDSFLAAMVWGLSSGKPVEEAFRYGVAAGSAALLTPGTELSNKDDIDRLYHDVVLSEPPKFGEAGT